MPRIARGVEKKGRFRRQTRLARDPRGPSGEVARLDTR